MSVDLLYKPCNMPMLSISGHFPNLLLSPWMTPFRLQGRSMSMSRRTSCGNRCQVISGCGASTRSS